MADNHLWVFKVDRRGLPVWEKFYDGPRSGAESAESLVRSPDGGYAMAGSFNSFVDSYWYTDAIMLKVDENGDPSWPMKIFGNTNRMDEQAFSIVPAPTGGYFLAGLNDASRPMVIRTDAAGNEVWTRNYEMEAGRRADRIGILLFR